MKISCVGAAIAAALAGAANAEIVCYSGSVALATTNWSNSIVIPQFNPALGTLNSISWTLNGSVAGSASYESLDASPTTVTLNLSATLTLFAPDSSTLQVTIPSVSVSEGAGAFDGSVDFDGASGSAFNSLSGASSGSGSSTSPALLAAFTGGGTVSLAVTGVGSSNGTGAGNLLLLFQSLAGADAQVCYDYTPIPTPGALALVGAGLAVAGRRRR
jgi:uncharacterized protein (TIGR03382 family)